MHRISHLVAAAAMLCASSASAYADNAAALVDRLHRAASGSSLDDASLKPWHLKLSFQLFDPKGVATEHGTIEEWWRSPTLHKTVYTSPSYTSTELQTQGGLYRTKGASSAPYLLELFLRQTVHPMPEEEDITNSQPEMRRETLGKVPMDCIMLSQEIKGVAHPPRGLFPTYCFDHDAATLRISFNYGTEVTVLNRIGRFQDRHVALDQVTIENGVTVATGHVDALMGMTSADVDFAPSIDFERVGSYSVQVDSEVVRGLALSQPKPIFPATARNRHVSGAVVIAVRIGRDGRVHSMKLVSIPDPDLAIAALAAVRQWRYQPYQVNGEPTEVQTTITVNFSYR